MSSFLSSTMQTTPLRLLAFLALVSLLTACQNSELNNPYAADEGQQSVLYQSFEERPKHLDPAVAYSNNEYAFLCQIYEPPVQYHYLKRPYQLTPLTASKLPDVYYLDQHGERLANNANVNEIAYTDYLIAIKPAIQYQPHPALAKNAQGDYQFHHLSPETIAVMNTLADFNNTGSRELIAEDYVYQIKRLAHPKSQSPIAEIMKNYIVGFDEFSKQVNNKPRVEIRIIPMRGVEAISRYQYRIRIKGKYPQFMYWLAMP
jgi:oligopeptide transport system substrate-binding protein